MKTVKPDKLSLLTRTIEHDHRPRFIVTVLAGFSFDQPKDLVAEIDLWPLVTSALAGEGGVLDEALAKVRGEVLVSGSCHVPGGEPTQVSFVRVVCGPVDKRLAVIGDRYWKHGVPTEPEPFTEMPVDWAHAFGGEGFANNPHGKGFATVERDGSKVRPLPHIELTKKLIASPSDRPTPASFAALELAFPARMSKAGTYDRKWLEKHAFGYPEDMDPTIFNCAREDQWLPGYFAGDETFSIENMHPTRPRIEGKLPPLTARVFVNQLQPDGERAIKEIETRLDTVRLLPGLELGVLVFRGAMEVYEDDAEDILELLIAGEDRELEPRPAAHYVRVLEERRDHAKAGLLALKSDDDLMPPRSAGWVTRIRKHDIQDMIEREKLLEKNLWRKKKKKVEEVRAQLLATGEDPADYHLDEVLEDEPQADPADMDAFVEQAERAEQELGDMRAEVEKARKAIEEQVRAAYVEQGQDYDEVMAKAKKDAAGPPKFSARQQLEMMQSNLALAREHGQPMEELERLAADPQYQQDLEEGERRLAEVYRQSAHMKDPVAPVSREDSEMFRAELEVAHHNAIALEARDFSGANLAEMDLAGMDLSGAFLEAIDASDTNLSRATLERAVLAHAKIHRTQLAGAKLAGANLGKAELDGADLSGADLDDAVLWGATLARSSLRGAHMHRTNLVEARLLEEVDLSEVDGELLVLYRVDLKGARLSGARLHRCVFVEVDMRGIDLTGADLSRSLLLGCQAAGVSFRGANLEGVKFVQETTLAEADFRGARMATCHLRGLDLSRALFDGATLDSADLSKCDMSDVSFVGARARNAMFMRTKLLRTDMTGADLMGALLSKARLHGTKLKDANLFQADMAKVRVDGETNLDGANMKRVNVHPKAQGGPQVEIAPKE